MPESNFAEAMALPLFAGISDESARTLFRGAYFQNFPPQIELISEGDPSDFLHILVSGLVELFATWNGRETCLATVRPVSTFILAATVKDAPYLMSARTIEKSRLILVPSEDVRSVFSSDAVFARAIVTELATCYRTVVKNSKDLKLRNSLERLANYILRQHRSAKGPDFELPLEKRRLAALLGMTPESLSRAFRGLMEHGIEVEGARVRVTDPARLEAFAQPSPYIDDYAT